MAKGMIKRGSGSAYTRLIRRRRAKQIRAEDSAPVEPVVIKSPLRRYERPDARPSSQTLSNRPPEYGGES